MMLELDPTLKPSESTTNAATNSAQDAEANASIHGTVEPCQFEELLERAMEIVRARRASVGSLS